MPAVLLVMAMILGSLVFKMLSSAVTPIGGDDSQIDHSSDVDPQSILARDNKNTDPLTQLPYKALLNETLLSFSDADATGNASIIILDLDNFKSLNDNFGHSAGDTVLGEIGELLKKHSGPTISPFRLGGDEFVVVAAMEREQTITLADFLRKELQTIGKEWGGIAASFGIASATLPTEGSKLMEAADKALYQAKQSGRNCVVTDDSYSRELASSDRDELLVDFENRVRTYADRMLTGMINRAHALANTLRNAADHDALTGLFNRGYLERVMSREFEEAKSSSAPLSLAIVDLDDFGAINRNHGFPTGDRVLAGAAKAIAGSVRANDWVARYGGEEFMIVMPRTDHRAAVQVGERVRIAISELRLHSYRGERLSVSGTVGTAIFDSSDSNFVDMIQRASDQVRIGKTSGKNQVN